MPAFVTRVQVDADDSGVTTEITVMQGTRYPTSLPPTLLSEGARTAVLGWLGVRDRQNSTEITDQMVLRAATAIADAYEEPADGYLADARRALEAALNPGA